MGDPLLFAPSEPVTQFDTPELHALLQDMTIPSIEKWRRNRRASDRGEPAGRDFRGRRQPALSGREEVPIQC